MTALFLLKCLYLLIPGAAANLTPFLLRNSFKKLALPIDFGRKLRKRRIFGDNKTFRGLIFGVLASVLFTYLQFLLSAYPFFSGLGFFDYSDWLIAGFLMGVGVMVGDLAGSFLKRRFSIKPGSSFLLFDQLGAVVGFLIFILPVYVPSVSVVLTSMFLGFFLHILVNLAGYYLGLKKNKF
jgi:CDP-2,3-bis-(O-geranylgeranyl)-sn-glycerol synthase